MHWEIGLGGDPKILRLLSGSFSKGTTRLTEDATRFVLTASALDSCGSAREAEARASEIVAALAGAAALLGYSGSIYTSGGVSRVDDEGKRHHFLLAEAGRYSLSGAEATLSVIRANGSVETPSASGPAPDWILAAERDPNVQRLLALAGKMDPSWDDLYRIIEVVEKVAGADILSWTSSREIARFKHTANSVSAAGDGARHGVETTAPPKNPMSLQEAREFVMDLTRRCVDTKAEDLHRGSDGG